jgi:hypothetical protein
MSAILTVGKTLRDKFLEDLANTKIIWDSAEKVAYKKGYADGYKDGLKVLRVEA